ncbi:MAG: hypothetical protein GXP62_01355, partial [Oligoflexia bacterium]|nr:hypothetical protein [Oligoflexia bacterium]
VTEPSWTARALAAIGGCQAWWATGDGLSVLVEPTEVDCVQRALHDAVIAEQR